MKKKLLSAALLFVFILSILPAAYAKTSPAGQTVDQVLFYITNSNGEEILVSQIPVTEMEADLKAGKIDATVHNYSLLDRYVTTLHQEAQGFSVGEFVTYAQSKSTISALKSLKLTFNGGDKISFWEIDQTGYDDMDTYTYNDLYGVARYNFPLLYQYWNYTTQDYYDPAGKLSRDEVIDYIFKNGEPEVFLLSVRAFSQRYLLTSEKYNTGDYNMENVWYNQGLMDNERTIRMMKPMTEDELRSMTSTAADTRYWVANIMLDMQASPTVTSLGSVAAPTATMTEDATNYYIYFTCATQGATILYNHNTFSTSYTPTSPYGDTPVIVPKADFKDGTVIMTARAVKEGYTDAGVVTLTLTSSGTETGSYDRFTDVKESDWSYDAVEYVSERNLIDPTSSTTFSPGSPMTRRMLVEALYRLSGSPDVSAASPFTDASTASVIWAYENEVVNGTSATTFTPDGEITREQIAAMMYRYVRLTGGDLSASGDISAFADAAQISAWAETELRWAVGRALINGTGDGNVAPQGTATREQVAQILLNFSKG